jgi:glycogen debranching enzyme
VNSFYKGNIILPPLAALKNRIDLTHIPFTERGSRILVMKNEYGLIIRLAERWYKLTRSISAYRQRPPIVEEWVFTNTAGIELTYQMDSQPDRIIFRTDVGNFILAFADQETLFLGLPETACGIRFRANMDLGQTDRRGGVLRVTGDIRRNLAYTTNRGIVENRLEYIEGSGQTVSLRVDEGTGGIQVNLTPRLGFNRYVQETRIVLERAEKHWQEWFAEIPPVLPEYETQYLYAWWLMAAGIISTRFFTTREVLTPSKIHYVGVWQWDALFHALAYRHAHPRLAKDQLRILLDHQREDGMLPDAIHDEGTITHLDFPVEADVTKPPLLVWTIWKIYETTGDREFLQETYEPAVRWINWWLEHNDRDGDGLCEYGHPFSSGLDDSPLWDGGMPVCSPDLNTYLILQMQYLNRIALEIGETFAADEWAHRAEELARRMDSLLWDEESGMYLARRNGVMIRLKTPFSLFPLLTGLLSEERRYQLLSHLRNETTFAAQFPVPSVAMDETTFDPEQMWRGPAWVNVNYLLVEGLKNSGFIDEAKKLRRVTLEKLMSFPDFYEYYNPLTGMPGKKAAPVFGWSAALFIDMALQETLSS